MCAITAICSDGGVNDELDEYLDKAFWNLSLIHIFVSYLDESESYSQISKA